MSRPSTEKLTKREEQAMLDRQGGLCEECQGPVAIKGRDGVWRKIAPYVREHGLPNFFRKAKPSRIICAECDKPKTKADLARIAKTKRQAGETGQQKRRREGKTKPIANRGFLGWRRFNGDVVKKG